MQNYFNDSYGIHELPGDPTILLVSPPNPDSLLNYLKCIDDEYGPGHTIITPELIANAGMYTISWEEIGRIYDQIKDFTNKTENTVYLGSPIYSGDFLPYNGIIEIAPNQQPRIFSYKRIAAQGEEQYFASHPTALCTPVPTLDDGKTSIIICSDIKMFRDGRISENNGVMLNPAITNLIVSSCWKIDNDMTDEQYWMFQQAYAQLAFRSLANLNVVAFVDRAVTSDVNDHPFNGIYIRNN